MENGNDFRLIYDLCDRAESMYPVECIDLLRAYRLETEVILSNNINPFYAIAVNVFLLGFTQNKDIRYSILFILKKFSSLKLLDESYDNYVKIQGQYGSMQLIEDQYNFCANLVGVRNARILNIILDNYDEFKETLDKIMD